MRLRVIAAALAAFAHLLCPLAPAVAAAGEETVEPEFAVPSLAKVVELGLEDPCATAELCASAGSFEDLRASSRQWAQHEMGDIPSPAPPATDTARWTEPVKRPLAMSHLRFTSGFGMREHPILGGMRAHDGVDIGARTGTPIIATGDGIVEAAGWRGGYGLSVTLRHAGSIETRYGHMSRVAVSAGQSVSKGQIIGFVGSTGSSTGPHLHYEVRLRGRAIDPMGQLASATPFPRP
mgnify:CR=1 FL=1